MIGGFDLHCGVADVVRSGDVADGILNFADLVDGEVAIDADVATQRVLTAGDRPKVQVVDAVYVFDLSDGTGNCAGIESDRRAFHENMQRIAGDAYAAECNQDGNDDAGKRVGPRPAEHYNQHGGNDCRDRAEQVADDVPKCATHVEVAVGIAATVHVPRDKNIDQ